MANNSQIGSPKESKICTNIKIMINTIEPLTNRLMEFSSLEFFFTEISVLSLYLDMDDNSVDYFSLPVHSTTHYLLLILPLFRTEEEESVGD